MINLPPNVAPLNEEPGWEPLRTRMLQTQDRARRWRTTGMSAQQIVQELRKEP